MADQPPPFQPGELARFWWVMGICIVIMLMVIGICAAVLEMIKSVA